MKKFEFADIYMLKAFVYGGLYVWCDNKYVEKGFLFFTLLMFVFYLTIKFDKK